MLLIVLALTVAATITFMAWQQAENRIKRLMADKEMPLKKDRATKPADSSDPFATSPAPYHKSY